MARGHLPDSAAAAPAFHFVKTTTGPIDASAPLDAQLESGVLPGGTSLQMLSEILEQVFVPLLSGPMQRRSSEIGVDVLHSNAAHESQELLGHVQKFLAQVQNVSQQLSGDVQLAMPNVVVDNAQKAAADFELVSLLESFVNEWTQKLMQVISKEAEKRPQGPGPLAEIDYWRERYAVFGALYEQLNLPQSRKLVEVLEIGSSDMNLITGYAGCCR